MKKVTKNLEDDHVLILKLTEVMNSIALSGKPDVNHIESIVEIIRNFADGLHHSKEENLFFPFLADKGFPSSQGPVAVMLHEHVEGRNFVKGILENLAKYKSGDHAALIDIYNNMRGYAELLQHHISKENNILFRMADNVTSQEEDELLMKKFSEAEIEHKNNHPIADYAADIQKLASLYLH
jgi:hemerythrin-like domain-containing protein